jgi:hypothetical protein
MRLLLIPAALILAACASATKTTAGDKCVSLPGDTTYTALKPAYRGCGLASNAVAITPRANPDYRPTERRPTSSCSSVELEFVVDEAGLIETNTARVVRSTNQQLTEAVVAVLPAWRYKPAMKDGKPVRQIVNDKVTIQTQVVAVPAGTVPSRGTTAPPRAPTTC